MHAVIIEMFTFSTAFICTLALGNLSYDSLSPGTQAILGTSICLAVRIFVGVVFAWTLFKELSVHRYECLKGYIFNLVYS